MKYCLSFFIALTLSCASYGQLTITSQAGCTSYTLTATLTGGLTPVASGINSDDNWSSAVPIGFTFTFYGVPYTQCIIGGNGEIGFDLGNALAGNSYEVTQSLQNSAAAGYTDIENLIAGPWSDIDILNGGSIMYSTVGTAPNRKFEVTYCATHMYNCTAQYTSSQIIIYETTNIAEVHISHKDICTTWQNGAAIVGVVNASSTASTTAPGRDWTPSWMATNEAWQFTPNPGGTAYTVAAIPYAPLAYATGTFYWYDSATHAYLGSGPSLPVAPTANTTYEAVALGCADSIKSYIELGAVGTSTNGRPNISNITSTNPSFCGVCDGTIKLYGIKPHQKDTVFSTFNGVPQPVFVDSTGADSIITLHGLCGGTYTYYVKVGFCPSNTVSATLVTPPPIPASFTQSIHLGCNGDSVILTNTSTPAGHHSYWHFGDGTPVDSTDVSPIHVFHDNPGYVGTYTVTLTYNPSYDPACALTQSVVDSFNHKLDAHIINSTKDIRTGLYSLSPQDTAVCVGTEVTYYGNSVSNYHPTYAWDYGDGTTGQFGSPTLDPLAPAPDSTVHTNPYAGTYIVKLTVTDSLGCKAIAQETVHSINLNVQTGVSDTSVCLVDSMHMRAFVTIIPNDFAYSVTWTPTNNIGLNAYTAPNGGDREFDTKFMGLGDYVYTASAISDIKGCNATDTQAIHSYPPVTLTNITPSQNIAWGGHIQLNADGALYYTWKPNNGSLDNPNINDPVATPIDSVTVYTVYGMSLYGCIDSASTTVTLGSMQDFIPSAFTPNGDGLNDVFRVVNMTFQRLIDFKVYNRWGQLVFHTADRNKGWDGTFNGTPQDMGVYNYQIIIGLVDGTEKSYTGSVTLIR